MQVNGRSNFGPSPVSKYKPSPIASGIVKMSENKMAASRSNLRNGWSVTSQANSAFLQSDIKSPASALVALYSGKYRPAWRIIHTGVVSTG